MSHDQVTMAQRAAYSASANRAHTKLNFVIRPRAMMMATQTSAMKMVQRFRFFSATPDVPAFWVRPPPNISDRPPPLPLCMRMSSVSRMDAMTTMISRTIFRICTGKPPLNVLCHSIAQGIEKRADMRMFPYRRVALSVNRAIFANSSGSSDAPPIRNPSTSGSPIRCVAFLDAPTVHNI